MTRQRHRSHVLLHWVRGAKREKERTEHSHRWRIDRHLRHFLRQNDYVCVEWRSTSHYFRFFSLPRRCVILSTRRWCDDDACWWYPLIVVWHFVVAFLFLSKSNNTSGHVIIGSGVQPIRSVFVTCFQLYRRRNVEHHCLRQIDSDSMGNLQVDEWMTWHADT